VKRTDSGAVHSTGRNSLVMAGGQLLGKGAQFASLMILSRYLQDTQFGMLLFAVAFGQILLFMADLGVSIVSNRKFSLDAGHLQEIYSTALGLRVLTTATAWSLVVLVSIMAGYGSEQVMMIVLVGIGSAMEAAAELQFAVFRARERMIYEAVSRVAGGFTTLLLVLAVTALGMSATAAAAVYTMRAVVMLALSLGFLRHFSLRIRPGFSRRHMLRLLAESWPLGVMGLLFIAFQRLDNVIVRAIRGVEAVGAYQEPYRILESLTLLITPTLLPGALFPGLCRCFREGRKAVAGRMTEIASLVTGIAAAVTIPLAAGGMELLRTVWGDDFLRGLPLTELRLSLILLTAAIPAVFWMNFLVASVIAAGRQRMTVPVTSAALVVSIACNLMLVPKMGIAGASLTVLGVNLLMGLTYWLLLGKSWTLPLWRGLARPLLPAIPAILLAFLVSEWSLLPRMAVPAILYLALWIPAGGISLLTAGRDQSEMKEQNPGLC